MLVLNGGISMEEPDIDRITLRLPRYPCYLNNDYDSSCIQFPDLSLVCMDGVLKAHKIYLAANSDKLKMWLLENKDEGETVIVLPDFTKQDVEKLLKIIYGNLNIEIEENNDIEWLLNEFDFKWFWHNDTRIEDNNVKEKLGQNNSEVADKIAKSKTAMSSCPRECGFSNEKMSSIKQHIRIVHNKVSCPHCSKFLSKSTLKEHIARLHTKDPSHQCESCLSKFYSKRDLEKHENVVHGVKTQSIICDLCGKIFTSRAIYGNHRFKCKINPLPREMVPYACVLNPANPNTCPVPGCHFKHKCTVQVKRHYRKKHERQVCSFCGKSYAYYYLKEHVAKEHTKELNFSCDLCPEKFFNETCLREHKETVHIKENLYVCDKCGEGFFSRKLVARHKNEVHSQTKHNPCSHCCKVFRHKKSLKSHVASVHSEMIK